MTGARVWKEANLVKPALGAALAKLGAESVRLIHGGAYGADWLCHVASFEFDQIVYVEVCRADWKQFGRAAGPMRNRDMLEKKVDLVLGFPLPESIGTFDCLGAAQRRGLPLLIAMSNHEETRALVIERCAQELKPGWEAFIGG